MVFMSKAQDAATSLVAEHIVLPITNIADEVLLATLGVIIKRQQKDS